MLLSMFAPIELLRDQSRVPPHEGVGVDEGRDLLEAPDAEWVIQRSKPPALGIGEEDRVAAGLGCEHAVFREEIPDDLLLMTLQPASMAINTWRIIVAPEVGGSDRTVRCSIHLA